MKIDTTREIGHENNSDIESNDPYIHSSGAQIEVRVPLQTLSEKADITPTQV